MQVFVSYVTLEKVLKSDLILNLSLNSIKPNLDCQGLIYFSVKKVLLTLSTFPLILSDNFRYCQGKKTINLQSG